MHLAITRRPLLDPRPLVALRVMDKPELPERRRVVRWVVEHSHAHTGVNILRRVHWGGFIPRLAREDACDPRAENLVPRFRRWCGVPHGLRRGDHRRLPLAASIRSASNTYPATVLLVPH